MGRKIVVTVEIKEDGDDRKQPKVEKTTLTKLVAKAAKIVGPFIQK